MFEDIIKSGPDFVCRLLARMQADCKYYLGGGMRNPKWLWALEESSHISLMRQLFRYLRELGEAPEWIDEDEIEGYALAMGVAA